MRCFRPSRRLFGVALACNANPITCETGHFYRCQFAGRWATINSIKALGYPCRDAIQHID
ncbi:hypothetical protein FOT57_14020 [Serratia ureilytica]|nr:hypothetical protein AM377_10310 [Serratia marcescens]TXE56085.1 hypothetical protein FOT57_14020 [Serratia ureilytica]